MPVSVYRYARVAAAIAIAALGAVGLTAPAAHAVSVIWRATPNVWTDSNALAECQALGKQNVATAGWDAYSCRPTSPPGAIQLWIGIWVGCNTCTPLKEP
jgi:hypothetical protein